MDDLARYCARMLGDGPSARTAEEAARTGGGERAAMLRAAVAAVREGTAPAQEPSPTDPAPATGTAHGDDERPTDPDALPEAIARELAAATGRLAQAEREALALRELLRLSHDDLADAAGVAPGEAALLLAEARLNLRAALRGPSAPQPGCDERERALRTMAMRQDKEAVAAAEDDWLITHLGHCRGCRQSHAAMLEASACYRAWASPEVPADPVSGAAPAS